MVCLDSEPRRGRLGPASLEGTLKTRSIRLSHNYNNITPHAQKATIEQIKPTITLVNWFNSFDPSDSVVFCHLNCLKLKLRLASEEKGSLLSSKCKPPIRKQVRGRGWVPVSENGFPWKLPCLFSCHPGGGFSFQGVGSAIRKYWRRFCLLLRISNRKRVQCFRIDGVVWEYFWFHCYLSGKRGGLGKWHRCSFPKIINKIYCNLCYGFLITNLIS